MRSLRLLAALTIALLALPVFAADAPAFSPTRFLITDTGTAGKPDVILIPDIGCSRTVWEDEAKLLVPDYHLHLVQIDGFGGIPARGNAAPVDETIPTILPGIVKELHAYIAANKMHPVIIGHSIGGLMAMMLADEHPQDVRKLVLVDTLPYYAVVFSPSATIPATKTAADATRESVLTKTDDRFANFEKVTLTGQVKDETARKVLLTSIVASDRHVIANVMYEQLQLDMRGDTVIIKTPTLVLYPFDATIQGTDPAQVDALYTTAYKAMPNATLQRIDGSRHFIMYDQPAKLDAAIEPFLK